MDQLNRLLTTLSVRQRWTIAIAAVLVAGGILAFQRWQQESGFRPLYTSLAPEDAASVVQKLKEAAVPYRISADGASVSVPQDRVPELRLEMAGAGLPKSGRIGFEIFDKSNFGMTDFAEHVNYRRALEGELERSVMAISQVEQARVHISFPQESVFTESRQPAKASVLLRVRAGARLPESAVPAITHMISSAVENLAPESVSVMDMRGELLNRPKRTGDRNDETSEAALEYQKRVEQSLAAKLDATLEPLIGAGRFRAAVSADCDMSSGEQSEESFDPTKSVMVSSQKTEDTSSAARMTAGVSATAAGIPGTASNLPDAAPRPVPSGGGTSRTTENINYQTSRTVKRTVLPRGSIRRLSVSILLDHEVHMEGTGTEAKRVLTPSTPERLKVIHDLAAAAIGFDMNRGDQLIVETLPFESTLNFEPLDASPISKTAPVSNLWYAPMLEALKTPKGKMIAGGAAGGLVLLLGALIFFMRKSSQKRRARMAATNTPTLAPIAERVKAEVAAAREEHRPMATNSPVVALSAAPAEQPIAIDGIRATALKEAEVSVGVLRGWLREGRA